MKTAELERLIESAYRGLEPPPALEAALPEERARPPRRGPLAVAAVLTVAALAAALARPRGSGLADGGEDADLPAVARPPTGVVLELGEETMRVRLTRDGRVLVKEEQVTLAQLGPLLKRAAESFHDRETAAGRSGYEEIALGQKASLLRVDLVSDREAPWRHVQWIMLVCAEQGMPRVAFAVRGGGGDFALDAGLPVDKGLGEEPAKVAVRIRDGERARYQAAVGGFALEPVEAEELASIARYLAAAREAANGLPVRGEVKAGADVPFHEVVKVLAEFRHAGYEQVDFYGCPPITDEVRLAAELPKPSADGGKKVEEPLAERGEEADDRPFESPGSEARPNAGR